MNYNCIVAINETTYLIAQGDSYTYDARNTYFFNFEKRTFTPGPQFITPRFALSCSKIRDLATGTYNIIAVGGFIAFNGFALNSTEIFDVSTQIWRSGPILPVAIFSAQLVEHYQGGVVLIGGKDENSEPQNSLYHLPSENGEWHLMEQKMLQNRSNGIAFLVPSSFVNCIG